MIKYESFHDKMGRIYGKMPLNVTLQVTEHCNLACTYCYQCNKSNNKMTLDVAKQFIDELLDGYYDNYFVKGEREGFIFDFIGGEPFLEIDLIDQISAHIIKSMIERGMDTARLMFSFSTNGTLYFDERVQAYLDKYYDYISMSITLDGDKELHDSCRIFHDGTGSYEMAEKALKHWQAKGAFVGTKLTICHENLPYLQKAIIHMMELGLDNIHMNCVYEDTWQKGDTQLLYSQLKGIGDYILDNNKDVEISMFKQENFKPLPETETQNWCGGDGRMIALDYAGRIFPCLRYMGSSLKNQKPFEIGRIGEGIAKQENYCSRCSVLSCITRQSQSPEKCLTCPVAKGCGWCSAYNYDLFGTPNKRATYHCEMHKATALANAYYWNKRFIEFEVGLPREEVESLIGKEEAECLREVIFGNSY